MNANQHKLPSTSRDGIDTINKLAYRDGSIYCDDWGTEPQVENKLLKKSDLAGRGLLFGIAIAALLGLISGALLLLAHQNQPSSPSKNTTFFPHTIQP